MRELEDYKDAFRVFEVIENTNALDKEGCKRLTAGHRFIGFYCGENNELVWISNTSLTLKASKVKEVYKIDLIEA